MVRTTAAAPTAALASELLFSTPLGSTIAKPNLKWKSVGKIR
jgi:hypothetical protein